MPKKICLFFAICITSAFLHIAEAQLKKLDLILDQKETPTECSYSDIVFIDDRPESEKKKLAINEDLFNNQLRTLLSADANNDKTMLVQLRKLYYKRDYLDDDKGKYYIQMSVYEKDKLKDSSYYWINTLSRSINNKRNDKQEKMVLSNLVTVFVNNNLATGSLSSDNLLTDLDDVVLLEKKQSKLYQTDEYVDGIYANFSSFANQTPDYQISSHKFKNDILNEVKYIDPKSNKERKISKFENYAVVLEGRPFLLENNNFIPIYKDEENNLCITMHNVQTSSVGVYFGLIGAVFFPYNTKEETSEVMIDHLNGELSLKSKKIEETSNHIFSKKPLSQKEKEIVGDGSNKKEW